MERLVTPAHAVSPEASSRKAALREVTPAGEAVSSLELERSVFDSAEIDVIGDTPRDIACGKAFGARTIAVATGTWSYAQLAEHQPDFLIADLSDVDCVIDTLGW